jgi:hypothetical protein
MKAVTLAEKRPAYKWHQVNNDGNIDEYHGANEYKDPVHVAFPTFDKTLVVQPSLSYIHGPDLIRWVIIMTGGLLFAWTDNVSFARRRSIILPFFTSTHFSLERDDSLILNLSRPWCQRLEYWILEDFKKAYAALQLEVRPQNPTADIWQCSSTSCCMTDVTPFDQMLVVCSKMPQNETKIASFSLV